MTSLNLQIIYLLIVAALGRSELQDVRIVDVYTTETTFKKSDTKNIFLNEQSQHCREKFGTCYKN